MNTTIPRWAREPVPGEAEHEVSVPEALLARVREIGPLRAAVLAAHAVVLAVLSGETEVVTGLATGACRIDTRHDSWRALLRTAEQAVPDPAGPPFETELDPRDGDLAPGTVLGVGLHGTTLRVRYRTDVLDAGAAARIAGYHVTALALLADDPDADPRGRSLLSAEELRLQLDGLAGPHRELPDRRAHELFAERVAAHPDRVAVVQGDRRWTYRELDGRANRLARALAARGAGPEDVVAVVTERNLDWAAAVLAVFKAGAVYLPIEPHFPADRIVTTLARAGCRLVLTEPGSSTTLDKALDELPGVARLLVDTAYAEDHADGDLGIAVAPGQLAYIYFTSGSTGQPKGAMCEHAGMLNHLFAKIDDLGIGPGTVVAQVAPQCFDISLWQLVSALLVGGETLVVEQEVVLDVARFVRTLAAARVEVLQVVPSYLEVVLTHLRQHGRAHLPPLPDLRCVSVTGEALKVELAQRFFAVMAELGQPDVALVNAYGLTETSDDTNHEVMREAPRGDRVPLGRPVPGVRVYVVDEHLAPVPLGAPGLIAFSGVCVGRGYVNDPERTAAAYLTDPHRPGERLYLGGDYGRWRPDGKLEFLGRRDSQVKISGFRIELGEIDNTLLRVPGVRDGAVVVAERPDRGRHLVAFYSGPAALDVAVLREHLGAALPHYMVPALFCWRAALPLTANGKIDTKALTVLARELGEPAGDRVDAPITPTERRLAAAWAGVLGVPEASVGRHDHFFDRGGSSLSAVELAVALDRAVKLKDVVRHPVLTDLAALLDARV